MAETFKAPAPRKPERVVQQEQNFVPIDDAIARTLAKTKLSSASSSASAPQPLSPPPPPPPPPGATSNAPDLKDAIAATLAKATKGGATSSSSSSSSTSSAAIAAPPPPPLPPPPIPTTPAPIAFAAPQSFISKAAAVTAEAIPETNPYGEEGAGGAGDDEQEPQFIGAKTKFGGTVATLAAGGTKSSKKELPEESEEAMPSSTRARQFSMGTHSYTIDNNDIYSKTTFSTWIYLALIAHIIQLSILLAVGKEGMSMALFGVLVAITVFVTISLIASRCLVTKKVRASKIAYTNVMVPDDEDDGVSSFVVYLLAFAAILEGIAFAVYTSSLAGKHAHIGGTGFYSEETLMQTLQFASITFLLFHRIIRPANRCDPLRTMLELEVVSVCWDALDGYTVYALLDGLVSLDLTTDRALRALLAFWYVSVGFRTALMFLTHLKPDTWGYKLIMEQPLALSPKPVIDRTLQALRQRSWVTAIMTFAELYAAGIRISLWSAGKLDTLQQEMTIKNLLFLFQIYGATDNWYTTKRRDWNTREIGFGLFYPARETQLKIFQFSFMIMYVLQGALLSMILANATKDQYRWIGNVGFDVFLVLVFYFYCRNCHVKQTSSHTSSFFMYPQTAWPIYPKKFGVVFSAILAANMYVARVPACYSNFANMASTSSGLLWTYTNAMLIVALSVLTIGFCGMYWYISYMLFNKEFTASPGNYQAIHDPLIGMVAMATQIEGAMDVLSAVTLMEVASYNLPDSVNGAVQLFILLEMANACVSFSLQALLGGGTDDTPKDLVRWKAILRAFRGVIDFGTFVLRIVLWVNYNAVSSVFIIKNLYNLLHTVAQVERFFGAEKYPKDTLFTVAARAPEWYGLTKEEWRLQTSDTITAQARAGRVV